MTGYVRRFWQVRRLATLLCPLNPLLLAAWLPAGDIPPDSLRFPISRSSVPFTQPAGPRSSRPILIML